MMNFRKFIPLLAALLALAWGSTALAQTTQLNEDFTGATSGNDSGVGNWLASGGACLTAGTQPVPASGSIPISIPACVLPTNHSNDVLSTYYNVQGDPYLVGGSNGYLGTILTSPPSSGSVQQPDPTGSGALRFTNGKLNGAGGYHQNGSIVSSSTYPTHAGLQVTFKTVTYLGDSGGAAGDGADGISFYLMDGCMPVAPLTSAGSLGALVTPPAYCLLTSSNPNLTIYGENSASPIPFQQFGSWGGSLAYTCSNANPNYDGLSGAYLGLGIDEYGNFLNGNVNTQGTAWSASGDNTATGGGYKPSRIGLRGAGNISWQALTNAYGTPVSPGDTVSPYYTNATCATGKYDSVLGQCESCTTGTYSGAGTGTCSVTASTTNCPTPPNGATYTYSYNGALGSSYQCVACPTGTTYSPTTTGSYPYGSCTTASSSTTYLTTATPSCSGGTYDTALGQCVSCPSGSSVTGGSSSNPACSAVTPTQSTPTGGSCATGTFDPALDHCVSCPSGTSVTGGTTSTPACTTVSPTQTAPTGGSCATGTYDPALDHCVACPSGSTLSGGTTSTPTCSAVAPTQTAPTGGSCTTGTFDPALDYCVSCLSGTLSGATTASPSCSAPAVIKTPRGGTSPNFTCATGVYDPAESGTDRCVSCPTGSTLSGATTSSPSCSALAVSNSGSPTSGTCSSGSYDAALGQCESCPSGTLTGGSTSTPSCSAPSVTNSGLPTSGTCSSGSSFDGALGQCESCSVGTLTGGTTSSPSCSAPAVSNSGLPTSGTCSSGSYDGALGQCLSCSTGTLSGGTTSSPSCSAPVVTHGSACATGSTLTNNMCVKCASGSTYVSTTSTTYPYGYCSFPQSPTTEVAALVSTTTPASASTPSSVSSSVAQLLVQATCKSGHLFNYNALVASLGAPSGWTLGNLLNSSTPTSGNATLPPDGIRPNPDANGLALNPLNTAGILDYEAVPGGYQVLSGTTTSGATIQIANESATNRTSANTILYNLRIAPNGLLSLSYSFNGAAYQSIIKNQSITSSNGPLPATVRYGFAGSTGGSSNIHEIMCFKSQPVNQSQSSVGVNQRQSAEIQPTGSFAYFSFYDTLDWTGRVTANSLGLVNGALVVNQTPTWDGSCTLSGVATGQTCSTGANGPVPAQAPTSRVILSYGGGSGVPFEAPGSSGGGITTAQLANLDLGDTSTSNVNRLNYLRGDTTNELANASTPCPQYVAPTTGATPSPGTPCFRPRDSVLGDIVDSSPVWVGPPQYPYTAAWRDKLYSGATNPESLSGAPTYQSYITAEQTRTNVVYVGANDGMLHGFRSGSFTAAGTFDSSGSGAPNDGQEVVAYLPGALLESASNSTTGCSGSPLAAPSNPMAATTSTAQNIHGVIPDPTGGSNGCVAPSLDYSNQNYGHNFFVDATPGTGDLFYNNSWHTWVVGGLGVGGAAIYALDVTNPGTGTTNNFSEANAATLVIGEWTPANLACVGDTSGNQCATKLGNSYGTPLIRRLHDGRWALIFGNGLGSAAGDAGIFVMTLSGYNGTTQLPIMTTYYLSTGTGSTSSPNGIAYVTSADLDGDHITDYVYAGDLQGHVWRFDLTSQTETTWAVTPGALFQTPAGQPITTAVTVASGSSPAGANTLMIGFGTGQKTQVTNVTPITYQYSQQALYGVWDWNMGTSTVGWNSHSPTQYASLTTSTTSPPPYTATVASTQLEQMTVSANTGAYVANGVTLGEDSGATQVPVCWAGTASCTGSAGQYGWFMNLPGYQAASGTAPQTFEQIVFNPLVLGTAFVVNSTVPAVNSTTQCTTNSDQGYTYAVSVMNGAVVPNFFTESSATQYHDSMAVAEQTNATGTSFPVTTANGQNWLVYQTVGNAPAALQVTLPPNYVGRRLTWVQLR
jgi:type IV pilus assembly protein PilY1